MNPYKEETVNNSCLYVLFTLHFYVDSSKLEEGVAAGCDSNKATRRSAIEIRQENEAKKLIIDPRVSSFFFQLTTLLTFVWWTELLRNLCKEDFCASF